MHEGNRSTLAVQMPGSWCWRFRVWACAGSGAGAESGGGGSSSSCCSGGGGRMLRAVQACLLAACLAAGLGAGLCWRNPAASAAGSFNLPRTGGQESAVAFSAAARSALSHALSRAAGPAPPPPSPPSTLLPDTLPPLAFGAVRGAFSSSARVRTAEDPSPQKEEEEENIIIKRLMEPERACQPCHAMAGSA